MKGNFHVRFLEELGRVIAPSYSANPFCYSFLKNGDKSTALICRFFSDNFILFLIVMLCESP